MAAAIEVHGVSKTFRIPHERQTTLVERMLNGFRPLPVEELAALDDVSFEIPEGCFAGLIGYNGSGKSTLLKVLAGLLVPDAGHVVVNGTLSPLLELGLGFHGELTVRENAALYGAVLGYPESEIDRRVDEVIHFAELERFRDAKLKSLSSGMLVRLAFSTALRADADVLLLDEVLAVGDVQFQRKCKDVFADLRQQNKTIVLVSHDVGSVTSYCDKVFWLDHGRLVMQGDAHEVVTTYLALSQQVTDDSAVSNLDHPSHHRSGDGQVRYVSARLLDETDTPSTMLRARSRACLALDIEAHAARKDPVFGITIRRGGETIYNSNTALIGARVASLEAGERRQIRMPFDVALANGFYVVDIAIADRMTATIHDWVTNALGFQVQGSTCHDGVADLAAGFESVAAPPSAVAAGREP